MPATFSTTGPAAMRAGLPPARVLVVDDDPAVCASIAFMLQVEGFDVETRGSAEAVLAEGSAAGCDCLVIDQRLAVMDGVTLLACLRAAAVSAPAIIMTSNPSLHLRDRIMRERALLVEKPLLRDPLAATIRRLIAGEG